MIGIYKITSPSGRIYIGQSINIEKRFITYKNYLNSVKKQPKLYRSLKKYGSSLHTFEVITECEANELNRMERYFQEVYFKISRIKSLNCVLTNTNIAKGHFDPDTCARRAKKGGLTRRKNNPKPIERIKNMVKINTDTGCWDWIGKSGNGIKKYPMLTVLVDNKSLTIPARRFSYNTFIGLAPQEKKVYVNCGNKICVNPDHLYLDEPHRSKITATKNLNSHKSILAGQIKYMFRVTNLSTSEIALFLNADRSFVRIVVNKKAWLLVPEIKVPNIDITPREKRELHGRKKVIDTKTKQIFESAKEASNHTTYTLSVLYPMLSGRKQNLTNLKYL